MAENTTEVIIGGVVLAAAISFGVYAVQITGISSAGDNYFLNASFRSLEGVSVGTDLRLAGVKIGTVTSVELNPQTFRADTIVSVAKHIEIPDDSTIVISSEGLLGGNFVEIIPGGSPFNLEENSEITDTQSAVSFISLLLKFVSGGEPK